MKRIKFSAKKVKKDSINALKLYMKNAQTGFQKLLTEYKNIDKPVKSHIDLHAKILDRIQSLYNAIKASSQDIDIKSVIQQCKEVIKLIRKLGPKRISQLKYFQAIDSFVMANSSALYYKDARYILEVPYMKRLTIFRKENFAKVVPKHFPYFRGVTISAGSDAKAVDVKFTCSSEYQNVKSILKNLSKEIERLLNWEWQKVGDDMYCEIHLLQSGTCGMIYCEMDVEPIVNDPSG